MLRTLVDLVYPPACLSCGAHGVTFLCDRCDQAFPWIDARCARCGLAVEGNDVPACRDCRRLRPAFASARAPARYEGVARDLLMAFKLGGERRAARHLAGRMLRTVDAAAHRHSPIVVAVPGTRRSLRDRGFNPAEELARVVARGLDRPYRPALRKVRETADQAGLGRAARRTNLAGAFACVPIQGEVLLVDDVITTGATADACARALLVAGAARVDVLAFARAGGAPPADMGKTGLAIARRRLLPSSQ